MLCKAFELIQMFNRGPVTIKQLQEQWNVDRRTPERWLTIMSLYHPIYEEWVPNPYGHGRIKQFKLLR